MPNIQLVRLDPTVEESLVNDTGYLEALIQDDWNRVAQIVHQHVGRTLTIEPISVNELQWGGYFVIDEATRELVGSCAFKAPPTEDGTVEIAYFTYPEFERRGYATSMARKLIDLAKESGAVRQVIAHTLPQRNASTRVLEKAGMQFAGQVMDADDGNVWRWCIHAGA
jgi:RimJ/RimL family protein N-acetyltransferase